MAEVGQVHVGDHVKIDPDLEYDLNGGYIGERTRNTILVVSQAGSPTRGERYNVVNFDNGGGIAAAIDVGNLTVVNLDGTPVVTEEMTPEVTDVEPEDTDGYLENDALTSEGIDSELRRLLDSGTTADMLKYNMNLFGIPHQFTKYTDYRSYYQSPSEQTTLKIGRKFIENIMMEAPVVTIIPGKPLYLPGAKDKRSATYALLAAANGNVATLTQAYDVNNAHKLLRYYDFQQDYFSYMKYVNIMCAVCAAFLDIGDYKIWVNDKEVPLTQMDWRNYRWNEDSYKMASGKALSAIGDSILSTVDGIKNGIINALNGTTEAGDLASQMDNASDQLLTQFSESGEEADEDFMSALETILSQMNFVQFYVNMDNSSFSESNDNDTSTSKMEEIFGAGSELLKEAAFIANSGGIDAAELAQFVEGGVDYLQNNFFNKDTSGVTSILSRFLSSTSNIIQGDNMVIPEIYQRSKYTKSYSLGFDFRSPYGTRLGFYLNELVPLMHLIGFAIPKQTTANTYGSPFLIKAYMPGIFSCNLGIVQSISIDKNASGDTFSIDGYPLEMKVSMTITDLYSDLTMTPAGVDSIMLFISNSSLIEFLATNCGINLTTPQLKNRAEMVMTTIKEAGETITAELNQFILGGLDDFILKNTTLV